MDFLTTVLASCLCRAWEAKSQAELTIERSLEAIGLIDEQHYGDGDDRAEESLFRHGKPFSAESLCVESNYTFSVASILNCLLLNE